MLLTVDIGNTHMDLGIFSAGALITHRKLKTRDHVHPSAFAQGVTAFVASHSPTGRVDMAAMASVVKESQRMAETLSSLSTAPCACVDASWDLGITVDFDDPETVGIDRLLAGAAAFAGKADAGAVVVADAGTALTVDAVDAAGVFRGGLIMPGLRLGLQALHGGTSLLPAVAIENDAPLLGQSTRACMLAGAVQGTGAMLAELFVRIAAHLDQPVTCFITGGDSVTLAPVVGSQVRLEPELVLHGLALAVARRRGSAT